MMRWLLTASLCTAVTFGLGCQSEDGHDHGHDHGPGSDHTHDEAGSGGNAAADHGEPHEIGALAVGNCGLAVTQFGDAAAGVELGFELELTGTEPKVIRLWVGEESGRGAMKARAEKEGATRYHAHVPIGDAFPPAHQLWVEVESADGMKSTAALSLHRE